MTTRRPETSESSRPPFPVQASPEQVALLGEVQAMLAADVDDFVNRFYERLWSQPGPREVLARLTEDELVRLKNRQAQHLLALLEPRADSERAFEASRRIGRVHAMVGVEIQWYASAISAHHQQIFAMVAKLPDQHQQGWLYATVAGRLMEDLQAALAGYRDVDAAAHEALARVSQAVSAAGTVPDLIQGVLEACAGVDGVTAGFFGRPDARDVFQFEMGVGAGAEEFMAEVAARPPLTISVLEGQAGGEGPSGRSWRTGAIERSDAYQTEAGTAPWHELGARLGWRSSASVPLLDGRGRSRALLSFYSPWPGFFAAPARLSLLEQVKHLLERALGSLELRGSVSSGVRAYSARTDYLARLHDGQVEMLYQPIVELRTGRVTKVEALARLQGEHRLVVPAEFLPAFGDEEMLKLFELGLDQALEAMKSWAPKGLNVGVSLNLPSVSSHDERYASLVEAALVRHRVMPSRLTLELLETGYVDGRPRWRGQVLDHFKALGVRLAQDDLGSGYSSLLRLRHFAFDDVKLDQSLIRGQEFSPRGALNFIQPLTSLAHSMGLNVIVEGLENRGLVEAALMLGADAGQGYGIARPMPGQNLPQWARDFRLDLDPAAPSTHLGGLAAHVAWEHQAWAGASGGRGQVADHDDAACPLTRYIDRIDDPSGHLAEAHAAVHRAALQGRGSAEHMRWWRVLTKMLGGRSA